MGGQRQAAIDDGDGLTGAQRAAGRLDFGPAVLGQPGAQLAEDGDDAADLLGRGQLGRQFQRPAQVGHAAADNGHLFVGRGRQRQHNRVKAPL